ncbi:PREDICTED: uncharacterized protein LOC104603842 [Nelumbo nucifera]|uniref:DC1 domain-containing protein n=2 Tax=Nelumbo nucifera TaxID=4432 RepID=A0A822ZES9_NELNU|nr:PREDICTED: uncharacterized protein LOC104603842 [Nelumbo nucifera]DAD41905.1 TPA_asm: hypothetical protein HUJ06_016228 [Nelumbo nucifera]
MINSKAFTKSTTFLSKHKKRFPPSMETQTQTLISPIFGEITHFSHPQHPLVQVRVPYLFTCTGCKEYGAGSRYKCQQCDVHLHEFCALAPPSLTTHSLHHQHHLVFYTKPGGGFIRSRCDICGKTTKGYAYRCSTCNFEMHPCCAKLCRQMDFPVHPHTLILLPTTTLTSGDPNFNCNECNRKGPGGRVYGCTVCDYYLHAVCAKNMVNGLYANGIKAPEKPSRLGAAVRLASHVVAGFIGGLLEGIGEGVGEAIFDSMVKSKSIGRSRPKGGYGGRD